MQIDPESDVSSVDQHFEQIVHLLKSNEKSMQNRHSVIIQNDNMNISYMDEDDMQRYIILMNAIKKLKI